MADSVKVRAGNSQLAFEASIEFLKGVNADLDANLQDAVHSGADASRSYLRANSPRESGKYARSWSVDREDRDGHHKAVVHAQAPFYRVTHLLMDGHESRNQYGGPYRRVGPAKPEGYMDAAVEQGRQVAERKAGVS